MHANGVQKLGVLKTETIKHRAGVAWYTFFFFFPALLIHFPIWMEYIFQTTTLC